MSAPKLPLATVAPSRSSSVHTASYTGSDTGPGAAAFQVGRRPFRASPYNVNWLITRIGASSSAADFSSRMIRRSQILRAIHDTSRGPSVWVTPTRATRPGPSISPTTFPSTDTEAERTR